MKVLLFRNKTLIIVISNTITRFMSEKQVQT